VKPSVVQPGDQITISIQVNNPSSPQSLLLGASLRLSKENFIINDPDRDIVVDVKQGEVTLSRQFILPISTPPGSYELWVALWKDIDRNGKINSGDRQVTVNVFKDAVLVNSPQNITIDTVPSRLSLKIDGKVYKTPVSFAWAEGTTHKIEAYDQRDLSDIRYVFTGWEDGELSPTRNITVGGKRFYKALFKRQYWLIVGNPDINKGTIEIIPSAHYSDSSGLSYYDEGTQVTVKAIANADAGFRFVKWSGDLYSNEPSIVITMTKNLQINVNWGNAESRKDVLFANRTSFIFYWRRGDPPPPPQQLQIIHAGTGTVQWRIYPIDQNGNPTDVPWLRIEPNTGTNSAIINISINTANLPKDGYIYKLVDLKIEPFLFNSPYVSVILIAFDPISVNNAIWHYHGYFSGITWLGKEIFVSGIDFWSVGPRNPIMYVFESSNGRCVRSVPGGIPSPDGFRTASIWPQAPVEYVPPPTPYGDFVMIWDAIGGALLRRLTIPYRSDILQWLSSDLQWSSSGRFIALMRDITLSPYGNDREIIVWDTINGSQVFYERKIYTMAWSPVGDKLAVQGEVRPDYISPVKIIDFTTGSKYTLSVNGILANWSPDGRFIFLHSSSADHSHWVGRIIDAQSGSEVYQIGKSGQFFVYGYPYKSAWHPSGKYFAVTGYYLPPSGLQYYVIIFDIENDRVAAEIGPFSVPIPEIVWSPDGSKIALRIRRGDEYAGIAVFPVVTSPAINKPPLPPEVLEPVTGIITSSRPKFRLRAQDSDSTKLQFLIEIAKDPQFKEIYKVFNQLRSLEGWSKSYYAPGEEAQFIVPPSHELENGVYFWRAYTYDMDSNQWSISTTRSIDGDSSPMHSIVNPLNLPPNAPILLSPVDNQVISSRPQFVVSCSDPEQDRLKFLIEISQDNFQTVIRTYDQAKDTTGWSQIDAASGETITFTLPEPLQG
jgi:hypothetical protein